MGWLLLTPEAAVMASAAELRVRSLEGIEVGVDQVTVQTDSEVRYRSFLTQDPPRLVVDLYDTQYRFDQQSIEGKGDFLQKVRSGQYRVQPRRISRVVMDLAKLVAYEVIGLPTGLRVVIGQGAAAAMGSTPAVPAAVPSKPEIRQFRDTPKEKPRLEEPPEMLRGGSIPKEIETEVEVGLPKPVPAAKQRMSRPDIMGSLPREKINLDFDKTDNKDVLKLLGVRAGVNIIYGPDVTGSLSLHLRGVPFDEAFRTVLQMGGLTTQQVGDNILRIMTPETLRAERARALPTTKVYDLRYAKAEELRKQIDAVRTAEGRPGSTAVSKTANALIVTDTPEGLLQVERLITQLDRKPQQVLIEAKLIEIQLSKGFDLGIQWEYRSLSEEGDQSGGFKGNFIGQGIAITPPPRFGGAALAPPVGAEGRGVGVFAPAAKVVGAFTFGRVTDLYFLTASLTAAVSQGNARVLSDPKVATLNNEEATINITTQIPYVTATVSPTAGTVTETVNYVTVGITLTVTPTINVDGYVTLKISPKVSQPSTVAASAGTTGAPAVDTRTAQTTVMVRDGETIVIGGLVQDRESETVAKVPFLGDLPILGFLFRSKSTSRQRQELLVFVTPKIMED